MIIGYEFNMHFLAFQGVSMILMFSMQNLLIGYTNGD